MLRSALIAASAAAAAASLRAPWKLDAAQVSSTLYSESLCPDCVHFETGVWNKAYVTKGIGYGTAVGDGQGILSFAQVSFGNAKITPDNQTSEWSAGAGSMRGVRTCARMRVRAFMRAFKTRVHSSRARAFETRARVRDVQSARSR